MIRIQLFERTYKINVGKESEAFTVNCVLEDIYHNIILTQKLSLENPIILSGHLDVIKAPNPECQQLRQLPERLNGLAIDKGFTKEVVTRLGGPKGCVNLVNMVLVSLPLVINATWLYHARTGQRSQDEIKQMEQELMAGVCLGYPKKADGESIR